HRERIEKDDLDIEENEEHRRQVEVDVEALLLRHSLGDAGLERDRAGAHAAVRSLREDEAPDHHRCRDHQGEEPVDRKRQPVVEQRASLSKLGADASTIGSRGTNGTASPGGISVTGVTKWQPRKGWVHCERWQRSSAKRRLSSR